MKPEPEGVHQVAPVAAREAPHGLRCVACHRPYQPSTMIAPNAAAGAGGSLMTPGGCPCGSSQFEGRFTSAAQPATPAPQAGSLEPETTEVLRELDDRTNHTWAWKRRRWAALVRYQAAEIVRLRAALAAPAVGAPGDALSVGVPPPPMSDADLWAAVCTGLGWGSPPIVQSTTSRLSFQAARSAVDARDAQWIAGAVGVRAAATLGGTGGEI